MHEAASCGGKPVVSASLTWPAYAVVHLQGVGWMRSGRDVCWYGNNIRRRFRERYYTLTFTLEFNHDFDLVSSAAIGACGDSAAVLLVKRIT
jgi:hypothetical protein